MNHRGLVLTEWQYASVSTYLENKSTIFVKSVREELDEREKERLWFALGYPNRFTVIVWQKYSSEVDHLIKAGLVVDLRFRTLPNDPGSLYDLFQEIIYGKSSRIYGCNQIRKILGALPNIRWVGSELESLYNHDIYLNAVEISGRASLGRKAGASGAFEGEIPKGGSDGWLFDFYQRMSSFEDPGQSKLALIMAAIPQSGYDVIYYVGGSPGNGWQDTLNYLDFKGKVIVFDPKPLSYELKPNYEIEHYRIKVESFASIAPHLNHDRKYVFIWDVRHDRARVLDCELKRHVIALEAAVLGEIFSNEVFGRLVAFYQIKINSSNCDVYSLPRGGHFYAQPFAISRGLYEVRYCGWLSERESETAELFVPTSSCTGAIRGELDTLKLRLSNGEIRDFELFLNFLTSVYRECDYIQNDSHVIPQYEVALFTLNWNSAPSLQSYFNRIRSRGSVLIGSFFTSTFLTPGEIPFDEMLLIDPSHPMQVFDSRALIAMKIDGLYFISSVYDPTLYYNEIMFSETYHIRATEYDLHSNSKMEEYDAVRHSLADSRAEVFPKFPRTFSLNQSLISPSGHALRMYIEASKGSASIAMFVHKIIANFISKGIRNISPAFRENYSPDDLALNALRAISVRFDNTHRHLERSSSSIWHSLSEWECGFRAASIMTPTANVDCDALIRCLNQTIDCTLKGEEIYRYLIARAGTVHHPEIRGSNHALLPK